MLDIIQNVFYEYSHNTIISMIIHKVQRFVLYLAFFAIRFQKVKKNRPQHDYLLVQFSVKE